MAAFEMPLEELKVYQGCSPRPADFDAYWQEALDEMEATGLEFEAVPADFEARGAKCYDVYFTGVGGARVRCMLLLPHPVAAPCPGLMLFHGYSCDGGSWAEKLHYATSLGMAVMMMEVRGQGGESGDVFSGIESMYGQVVRGVDEADARALFYRAVFTDTVKAARILMSLDEVDETRVAAHGKSQGGALTVACAALEPRIAMMAPVYPYLSDFRRLQEMDLFKNAYAQFNSHFRFRDPLHEREDAFYERLGYIDIQNLAPRVKAETLWFLGMMDQTCPPSTQFAAYNKLSCKKSMLIYPEFAHEHLHRHDDKLYTFLARL